MFYPFLQGAFCFGPNPIVPEAKLSVVCNLERLFVNASRNKSIRQDDSSDFDDYYGANNSSGATRGRRSIQRQQGINGDFELTDYSEGELAATTPSNPGLMRRRSSAHGSFLRRPAMGWTTLVGFDSYVDRPSLLSEQFSGDLSATQSLCMDLGCGG